MPITVNLTSTVPGHKYESRCGFLLNGKVGNIGLRGQCGQYIETIVQNAKIMDNQGLLDIRIAIERGFIIADISDKIGYNALNRGQRDKTARLVRDKNDRIGE